MKWAELLVPFFNVVYVIIAILMIGLILMQRGAGAQAGSSFGAGASGTVFGARGSANFLSRSTAICAVLFFIISIGMGIYVSHGGRPKANAGSLMGDFAKPADAPASELPGAKVITPAVGSVPNVPAPMRTVPPANSTPAGTTTSTPAVTAPVVTSSSAVVPAEVPTAETPAVTDQK
jgi:preprotein translocase subunit SecG